jgi:hypothetical protein
MVLSEGEGGQGSYSMPSSWPARAHALHPSAISTPALPTIRLIIPFCSGPGARVHPFTLAGLGTWVFLLLSYPQAPDP